MLRSAPGLKAERLGFISVSRPTLRTAETSQLPAQELLCRDPCLFTPRRAHPLCTCRTCLSEKDSSGRLTLISELFTSEETAPEPAHQDMTSGPGSRPRWVQALQLPPYPRLSCRLKPQSLDQERKQGELQGSNTRVDPGPALLKCWWCGLNSQRTPGTCKFRTSVLTAEYTKQHANDKSFHFWNTSDFCETWVKVR